MIATNHQPNTLKKYLSVILLLAIFFTTVWSPSLTTHAATIKMSKAYFTLLKGKTQTLKVNGTKSKAIWFSSDKSIATVTQGGVVKGIKVGHAVIYAKIGKKNYTSRVTVEDIFTIEHGVLTKYNGKGGKVVIPSTVKEITYSAFDNRNDITSVTMPDSVTTLTRWPFSSCKNLAEIKFSKNLKHFSAMDFRNTLWLKNQKENNPFVIVNGTLIDASGCKAENGKVTIPDTVSQIANNAFENRTDITSIVIPDSVTELYGDPFNGCTNLENIDKPESLNDVFYDTLWYKNKQKESPLVVINGILVDAGQSQGDVVIPDTVHTISGDAFNREDNALVTSITIPSSVTTINDTAFYLLPNLTTINIPKSVKNIGDEVFYGTPWLINQRKKTPLVIINGILVDGIASKKHVTIPKTVTRINDSAFKKCDGITGVTIPTTVTSIGYAAFQWCEKLTQVNIPSSVTSIGGNAFYRSKNLNKLTIPNSVTHIGKDAFYQVGTKFIIHGNSGSYAQAYAKEYNLLYEPKSTAKFKLNRTQCVLFPAESTQLKLLGTKKKVTWSTNNKYIVSVTSSGKITGHAVGTANIYAKVGTKTWKCTVKVTSSRHPTYYLDDGELYGDYQ